MLDAIINKPVTHNPVSPILTALRAATHSQHSILDQHMPLAKKDAVWADYVAHLQLLGTWLMPLEDWFAQFNDGPQGTQAPALIRRSHLILADLAEDKTVCTSWPTSPINWTKQDNAAYRWGISYVVEGAQLGGAFLYRRLHQRLEPHRLRYLHDEHASSGRWPAFLQAMASAVTTPEQISSACTGAVDAFDALLQQLNLENPGL